MALLGKKPLTPDHPFYGGRIIFGAKRPDLSVKPSTEQDQTPETSEQVDPNLEMKPAMDAHEAALTRLMNEPEETGNK